MDSKKFALVKKVIKAYSWDNLLKTVLCNQKKYHQLN